MYTVVTSTYTSLRPVPTFVKSWVIFGYIWEEIVFLEEEIVFLKFKEIRNIEDLVKV